MIKLKGSEGMKKAKYFIIYFLIAGLSLSYGAVSYLRDRNRVLDKISQNEITYPEGEKTEPVLDAESNIVVTETEEETYTEAPKTREAKTASAEATVSEDNYVLPVSGAAIEPFSGDTLVYSETMHDFRVHSGLDFKAEEGENVLSVSGGTVFSVSDSGVLGKTVKIDHGNGLQTVYGLLGETFVKKGDTVLKGDVLGTCSGGSGIEAALGAHLHFEALKDGVNINPESLFDR